MAKIKVAVIFGGTSGEHNISLLSAERVIENIPKDKYEVLPIGITEKGRWFYYPGDLSMLETGEWEKNPDCTCAIASPDTIHSGIIKLEGNAHSNTKVDVVFPLVKGMNGEDGAIQGILEMAGIPFVGSRHTAAAVCMDKDFTKAILSNSGIKTARWTAVDISEISHLHEKCDEISEMFNFPVFVKPASSGSSIGVNKVYDRETLEDALKLAFTHGRKAIVEEFIDGRELECAVLGNDSPKAMAVGEIKLAPNSEFFDYNTKYLMPFTTAGVPAEINRQTEEKVKELAVKAYKIMGCSGFARVDFFLNKNNEIILNEINTAPEFISGGMYEAIMNYMGIPFTELLDKLIMLAFDRAGITLD